MQGTITRAAAVRPVFSTKSRTTAGPLVQDESSFGVFGRWSSDDLYLSGERNHFALARWMSLNERSCKGPDALWEACMTANRSAFQRYRALRLFDKSLNLRTGDVVFQYVIDPVNIPDNPPASINDRLVKAICKHPDSTIYCLEPVFLVEDDVQPVLMQLSALQEQANDERESIERMHRRYRLALRTVAWAAWKAGVMQNMLETWAERKALEGRLKRLQARGRTEFRGYEYEIELQRIRTLAERATNIGAQSLSSAISAQIENLLRIDPILTFTLPSSPDLHRFIGHWFWGWNLKTKQRAVLVHV